MKKLKRIIEICKDISVILLLVLCILSHLLELFEYAFVEKLFQKIGITNHLRFCLIVTVVVIVIDLIFDFVFDKMNRNH